MPPDRRQYPRYEVTGITSQLDGHQRFAVRVLGLGGMLVESTRELAPGEQGNFVVDLPYGRLFRSRGRVLYLGPIEGGAWRIGVAFEDTTAPERQTLEGFLAQRIEGPE